MGFAGIAAVGFMHNDIRRMEYELRSDIRSLEKQLHDPKAGGFSKLRKSGGFWDWVVERLGWSEKAPQEDTRE
jgi:hypothetical protein